MIQVYFVLAPGSADGQHPVIRQRKLDAGRNERCRGLVAAAMTAASPIVVLQYPALDRKSGVWGKSVSVRVDLGGWSVIKNKNRYSNKRQEQTHKDREQVKGYA